MKITNEIVEYIKNSPQQHLTVAKLCRALNIDRKTYYNWLHKAQDNSFIECNLYTDFFEAIYNKRIELKTQLENQLIEMSKDNHKVCIYLLDKIEKNINDFEHSFFTEIPKLIESKKRQSEQEPKLLNQKSENQL